MSELRKELVTGRWVIIATERSKRPDDFRPPAAAGGREEAQFCPFCAGNEAKTPPEVFALRDGSAPDQPGWRVRVVPNKFPALNRGPAPKPPRKDGLFQSMAGIGVHEVVIENPDHGTELSDLPVGHVVEILRVLRDRVRSIEEDLHYQYVQVFKNKGREAGASLSHPHSQIIATPIVPKRIKEEIYGADRLHRKLKECYFCRLIREEMGLGKRVVYANAQSVAMTPFASRFPFETAIYPSRHSPFFNEVRDEELAGLAEAMKKTLTMIRTTLFDPPYNMILHMAPNPSMSEKAWPDLDHSYHWHFEILPILTRVAGFEYGTGFYINPVTPETAAEFLRREGSLPTHP